MATLVGIFNENDFYSPHYLQELLSKDIGDLVKKWKAQDSSPPSRFKGLGQDYFKIKETAMGQHDNNSRFITTASFNWKLAEALGYQPDRSSFVQISTGEVVPLLGKVSVNNQPYIWLAEAPFKLPQEISGDSDKDPLSVSPVSEQQRLLSARTDLDGVKKARAHWLKLITEIFTTERPPRWLILFAGNVVYLFERHKWTQSKHLSFDIDELLGRGSIKEMRAACALLSRDSIAPDSQEPSLLDTLDENSHQHAFAVSADLKYGMRKAVELLGNEYVWYKRIHGQTIGYQSKSERSKAQLASTIKDEALIYLYRLLFLFFAEARGDELGIVPTKSEEYRRGYSLEFLRDLELMPLTSPDARDGYFIHNSLEKLFQLMDEGFSFEPETPESSTNVLEEIWEFDPQSPDSAQSHEEFLAQGGLINVGFSMDGLKAPLFESRETPHLSQVKFRNCILQQVIRLLSLSREGGSRERGRISYAQLGINQLGAVYEGILSYSAFFAPSRVYEVRKAGASERDESVQSYFVTRDQLSDYKESEIVKVKSPDTGKEEPRIYEPGDFIFRLASRQRSSSASYYTPEVLTSALVELALKELPEAKEPEDYLDLTICEPALGSGAFINETVNQLAQNYLTAKQRQTGQKIPPALYTTELQKVKAHIATHNCYGVDLNPTATRLAKVSLWLNTIYPGSRAPWFGFRLATGNSLVGARAAVFELDKLKGPAKNWYKNQKPRQLEFVDGRPHRQPGQVYHFLLPTSSMADFADKKDFRKIIGKAKTDKIRAWQKDFTGKLSADEKEILLELSRAIDELWAQVVKERRKADAKTRQNFDLWPHQSSVNTGSESIAHQESIAAELERPYTAYSRLKLVMDYWCSLYFWPVEKLDQLPTYTGFLMELEIILKGSFTTTEVPDLWGNSQSISSEHKKFLQNQGMVDVEQLVKDLPTLQIVDRLRQTHHFMHWQLRFAEVFAERGGFDLIVGNPPWVKLEWTEKDLLAEFAPYLALRKYSSPKVRKERGKLLEEDKIYKDFLQEYIVYKGSSNFLSDLALYPILDGIKNNLYKNFIVQVWKLIGNRGISGLLHPEGIYDGKADYKLRREVYRRLRAHYQFRNELKLFEDIHSRISYSVNIYGSYKKIKFKNSVNLFHPKTLIKSFKHNGKGPVPGIKDDEHNWNLQPHAKRIYLIEKEMFKTIGKILGDNSKNFEETKLPVLQSKKLYNVLYKFTTFKMLEELDLKMKTSQMWNQTNAVKDGIIKKEEKLIGKVDPQKFVVSGPSFFVANPFNKTPNENCKSNTDYSVVDLEEMKVGSSESEHQPGNANKLEVNENDEYPIMTGSSYSPALEKLDYLNAMPTFAGKPYNSYYRIYFRRRVNSNNERTVIPSIYPAGPAHIDSVFSITMIDNKNLLKFSGLCSSLIIDFLVKITGKSDFRIETLKILPFPQGQPQLYKQLILRTLELNCLNELYDELWGELYDASWRQSGWSKDDHRLPGAERLGPEWSYETALRNKFARRQALVEIDALAALIFDLSLEELLTIYRVQFPVLKKYEDNNRYDQKGQLVPAKLLGKATRKLKLKSEKPLQVIEDSQNPGQLVYRQGRKQFSPAKAEKSGFKLGICPETGKGALFYEEPKMWPHQERAYVLPFEGCNREEDLEKAYKFFAPLRQKRGEE